jgi:ubiquinone/menaquinone biosynthesis C-methylase UbiE
MSWFSEKFYTTKMLQCGTYYAHFQNCNKILDVGCSIGNFTISNPERVVGIDLDKDALIVARKRGLTVMLCDITYPLPFKDNVFDGVYCSHVFEHLDDPLSLLTEMRRILTWRGEVNSESA